MPSRSSYYARFSKDSCTTSRRKFSVPVQDGVDHPFPLSVCLIWDGDNHDKNLDPTYIVNEVKHHLFEIPSRQYGDL